MLVLLFRTNSRHTPGSCQHDAMQPVQHDDEQRGAVRKYKYDLANEWR